MDILKEIEVSGHKYPVELEKVFSGRSSVRIKNGKVVIRLSRFALGKKSDEVIRKFLRWAIGRLSVVSKNEILVPEYRDGGVIRTHNKIYEVGVRFENRKNVSARLIEGRIVLRLSPGNSSKVREIIEKVIIKDQTQYLHEVLEELNQLYFQEKFGLCRFKRMNHRFGSCSSRRNINIAYRLLFAPREVFRYVCLHELVHLKEMNHSKKFWRLVEETMPDYRKCEKWLSENGFMLG